MTGTLEFVKALLQFLFLFGLVLVLAWLATRVVGQRMGFRTQGNAMRILQHIPAGRDRSLMLLALGGRIYLLGITAEQITLLDAIEDTEAIQRVLDTAPEPNAGALAPGLPRSFTEILGKVMNRFSAPPGGAGRVERPSPSPTPEAEERLRDQIERLRHLQKEKR